MNQPVFVKLDEYEELLNVLDVLQANINKTKQTIQQIDEVRKQEEETIQSWNMHLEDITKKMQEINKTLFEPKP